MDEISLCIVLSLTFAALTFLVKETYLHYLCLVCQFVLLGIVIFLKYKKNS